MEIQYIIDSESLRAENGGYVWSVPDGENLGERREVTGYITSDYSEGGFNKSKHPDVKQVWMGRKGAAEIVRRLEPTSPKTESQPGLII